MLSVTWPPTSIFFPVPKYIFVPEIHRQHIHTYIHLVGRTQNLSISNLTASKVTAKLPNINQAVELQDIMPTK